MLVRRGVPFRQAHGIVAGLVRYALDNDKRLSELLEDEVRAQSEDLLPGYHELLAEGAWLESKVSEGGTSLARVREQIERAREVLAE
jgi:argininosuccinate lyase